MIMRDSDPETIGTHVWTVSVQLLPYPHAVYDDSVLITLESNLQLLDLGRFRFFSTVFRPTLHPVGDTSCVERTAYNVITNAR